MELQELMFALLGFSLVLSPPVSISLSSPLEWECLACATVCQQHFTSFFYLQGLTGKSLSKVSEETLHLDFSLMLKLLGL